VGRLIGEARRRILGNEVLAQGANTFSAALSALILLLLLGSEILSWPVIVFVPLAALAIGVYRVRKRMPSTYQVAQLVDGRLGLDDAISTAIFFEHAPPDTHAHPDVLRVQREYAERAAASGDARRAVPYVMPRSAYLLAALMVAAVSLFALRYGLSRRLDLKQPLASFLPESLKPGHRTEQAANRQRNPKQVPQAPDENGEGADQDQAAKSEQNPDQPAQTEAQSEAEGKQDSNAKMPGKQQGQQQPDSQMATDDQQQNGENGSTNSDDNQDGQQGESKNSQQQSQQAGNKQEANSSNENSSIMDKMKDAFQNLLSKVKPQQQQSNGQQQDQKGQQGKAQQGAKQQNGKQGQQQSGQQQGDAQEGENGEQAKNDENAQQQKGQGKSDSQQATKQPGSGVGSQDGDKAIKNAEQLAAMGKLSEIMGKRSQTITGEATVEVQQTNQQLKTNYVNKGAQHSQGGAEISRDEVPVALQPYVQQYFEQVRKQAVTTPATAAPGTVKK
jgi:hypothetical protein